MIEFLKSRSTNQWLLAIAWLLMMAVLTWVDIQEGKVISAIISAAVMFLLFMAAAYKGHIDSQKRDAA